LTKKSSRPSTADGERIILGIDPGTLVTGYGLIGVRGGAVRLLECGTIANRSATPMAERLSRIYRGLCEVIDKHHPGEAAVETAFYGRNVQSALKLGHARGVSLLAAVEHGLTPLEYSPREVKQAVVGRGNASKEQVQFMVKALLRSGEKSMLLDASDALAVALCHLHRKGQRTARRKNWAAFIAEHPELVRT
jgi:crossover junction endodeoxyribonuclease RuvC